MAGLTSAQQKVVRAIFAGAARGHSDGTPVTLKELKAALETGHVESNFTNSAAMTDHDSQGWRQERASLYKDPTNLTNSVRRFFDETGRVKGQYGSAGALAAAVQRPAAQYRGRYAQASGIADALLASFDKSPGASSGGATSRTTTVPGYTGTATGVAGGQPIALPDTGQSNLAALLASVNQKPAPVMTGGQIADPSFSASRYVSAGGSVQPVGLNSIAQESGIADQLAALASVRSTEMPAVANQASVSSRSVNVPGTTVTTSSKGAPSKSAPQASVADHGPGKVSVVAGANRAGVTIQKPILGFLKDVSASMGRTIDVTTGTNHNRMTTSGNVSDHWDGNATDLGMGGDARQSQAVDRKGTLVAAHALQVASAEAGQKLSFNQAYSMAHRGGLWNFETKAGRVQILWKTLTGGNHYNHVHVGLNPNR